MAYKKYRVSALICLILYSSATTPIPFVQNLMRIVSTACRKQVNYAKKYRHSAYLLLAIEATQLLLILAALNPRIRDRAERIIRSEVTIIKRSCINVARRAYTCFRRVYNFSDRTATRILLKAPITILNTVGRRKIERELESRSHDLGCSPIFAAAHDGNMIALRHLVTQHNVNQQYEPARPYDPENPENYDPRTGTTLLMEASSAGQIEAVQWLLAQGADQKIYDELGERAIDKAVNNGNTAIQNILTQNSLRTNKPDDSAASRELTEALRQVVPNNPGNKKSPAQTCPICLENTHDMISLRCCQSKFCRSCLNDNFRTELKTLNIHMPCPNNTCKGPDGQRRIVCPFDIKLFTTPLQYTVFTRIAERAALNRNNQQCPTPDCSGFIPRTKKAEIFRCETCSLRYCTQCLSYHPTTQSCSEARSSRLDPEGRKWERENTRTCPRCSTIIHRSDGCNHMTCQCGHQFCLVCLRAWKEGTEHVVGNGTRGYYTCRFDPTNPFNASPTEQAQ